MEVTSAIDCVIDVIEKDTYTKTGCLLRRSNMLLMFILPWNSEFSTQNPAGNTHAHFRQLY